ESMSPRCADDRTLSLPAQFSASRHHGRAASSRGGSFRTSLLCDIREHDSSAVAFSKVGGPCWTGAAWEEVACTLKRSLYEGHCSLSDPGCAAPGCRRMRSAGGYTGCA